MKKILALTLALVLCLGFMAACTPDETNGDATPTPSTDVEATVSPEPEETATPEPEETEEPEEYNFVGTWSNADESITIVVAEDGTCTWTDAEGDADATWTIADGVVTITLAEETLTATFTNADTITINDVEYARVADAE